MAGYHVSIKLLGGPQDISTNVIVDINTCTWFSVKNIYIYICTTIILFGAVFNFLNTFRKLRRPAMASMTI